MILSYKIYADEGRVWCAFLEYGDKSHGVSLKEIEEALKSSGIEEYNHSAISEHLELGSYALVEISDNPPKDLNGACWVASRGDGGIIANIVPACGKGRQVNSENVIRELNLAGYGHYYIFDDEIRRNVQTVGRAGKLVSFLAAEPRPAEVKFEIAKDKKSARMTYQKALGGNSLTYLEVLEKLQAAGVIEGIDEEAIKMVLEKDQDAINVLVASAIEPQDGNDATIKYLFDVNKSGAPRINDKNSADYRDLGLFNSVEKGTPLAVKTPATEGVDGIDVTGVVIKAKRGRDIPLPKGKNTTVSEEDENVLLAAVAGVPKFIAGKVCIEDVLVVQDVDFSTGNINFSGDVFVKGIVNNGFSVIAGGDISCADVVEGAHLSAGGNVILKRGMKGLGKGMIQAGGNVHAKFIERCTVIARGSIVVEEALIHSAVSAGDSVLVTGAKGSIFGGHITAGSLVKANFIGSEMAISTVIEVGAAPHLRKELSDLTESLEKKEFDYSRALKNLDILEAKRSIAGLSPKHEELYATLIQVTGQLEGEIENISSTIASLQEELERAKGGRVEAGKVVYPGVKIVIRNATKRIYEPVQSPVFVKDGAEVVLAGDLAQPSSG